jgi:alkylhydroperoxidase family enzyme
MYLVQVNPIRLQATQTVLALIAKVTRGGCRCLCPTAHAAEQRRNYYPAIS